MAALPTPWLSAVQRPRAAITRGNDADLFSPHEGLRASHELDVLPRPHDTVEKTELPKGRPWSVSSLIQWWKFYINPILLCQDTTGHLVHDPRDFLALERTHLAYVRTSNALALFGVTMAQLFILHDAGSAYGKVLASCAYGLAISLTICSAVRVVWIQDKIVAGQMATVARLFGLVTALLIALLLAIFVIDLMI